MLLKQQKKFYRHLQQTSGIKAKFPHYNKIKNKKLSSRKLGGKIKEKIMKKYYAKKEGNIFSFSSKKERDIFLANAMMQFYWDDKDKCYYYIQAKKMPSRNYAKVTEIS